jgi:hypothetical protein
MIAYPLKMIQAIVGLNWPSIFREEDLFYKTLRTTDGRRTPSEGKGSPDSLGQVS